MPETTINDTIVAILYKLVSEQSLLPEEQAVLDSWLAGSEHKKALLAELLNEDRLFDEIKKRYAFNTTGEWLKMVEKLRAGSAAAPLATGIADPDTYTENAPVVHRVHFLKTSWFRYAAAVVVIAGGAAIWYANNTSSRHFEQSDSGVRNLAADIQPGTNRAVLTVGDQSINLSSNKTGIAVGNAITYNDGERIADAGQILTLSTPRGGQYQATLPDGSKIWLNAASKIKFPSKFTGAVREIEVSGEAYLEVVQNVKQSFVVKANGTEVQVLGTSFNINAYADESSIKTTLVEGSVKVKIGEKESLLKPGQQASVGHEDRSISLTSNTADIDQALAWRNGFFNFNNADIKGMMRQLERWYDIEVRYEGKVPERVFEGKMQRNIPLSSALKILELNKINFRVEGRKIIVMP